MNLRKEFRRYCNVVSHIKGMGNRVHLWLCVDGTDDDSKKSGSYIVNFVSRYLLVKQLVNDFCWYQQETII
jgi:hypothetical protein